MIRLRSFPRLSTSCSLIAAVIIPVFAMVPYCVWAEAPPFVSWATNAGGALPDSATAVTADSSGNVYVAGVFGGTATFGTNSLTASVGYDLFVAKMNPSGQFLWVKDIEPGVPELDPFKLTLDGAGNVLVMTTISGDVAGDSLYKLYLAKLDASGNLTWTRKIQSGAFGGVIGGGIVTDSANNIYVAGNFDLTANFGSGISLTSSNGYDVFLAKFSTNGTTLAVRGFGQAGSIDDEARGVTLDASGNIYVAAHFGGTMTIGATQLTSAGGADIVLVKYDSGLNPVWAKRLGVAGDELAHGLVSDASGNLYLLASVSQQITVGSTTLYPQIDGTFMVARFDNNGNALWGTLIGPGQYGANIKTLSESQGFATDAGGYVYVTGKNYFAKLNPTGAIVWARSASGVDDFNDVAVTRGTNYFLCGRYSSPATFDTVTLNTIGSGDLFVARMVSNSIAPPLIAVQPKSQSAFLGTNITLTVTATGAGLLSYQWFHGAVAITGATNASVTLTNISFNDSGVYTVQISNTGGTTTSSTAQLDVLIPPPAITTQPLSQTVNVGDDVNFTVAATGYQPLVYQWRLRGTNIPLANTVLLPLRRVTTNDAGPYTAVASNQGGSTTSLVATLTIKVTPPTITFQPQSIAAHEGDNVTFNVSASGTPPLAYQWRKNGTNIPSATGTMLVLPAVTQADAGDYMAVVSNSAGSTNSQPATLSFIVPTLTGVPFTWVKRIGGICDDGIAASTMDAAGNLYIAGTPSTPPLPGLTNSFPGCGYGCYVAKLDSQGNVLWATNVTMTGTQGVTPKSIVVSKDGYVFVAGSFNGTLNFSGGITLTSSGFSTLFLAKYDPAGKIVWARRATYASANGLAVDDSGATYLVGVAGGGTAVFGTISIVTTQARAFLAKCDTNGNFVWVKHGGAVTTPYASSATGESVAVDSSGNVWLAGEFAGTMTFGTNTFVSPTIPPGTPISNGFAIKFDSDGNLIWIRQIATANQVQNLNNLVIQKDGVALLAGSFIGNFTFDTLHLPDPGTPTTFLLKILSNGTGQWITEAPVQVTSLALDGNDNAYVCGNSSYQAAFGSFNVTVVPGASKLMCLAMLGNDGQWRWARGASGFRDADVITGTSTVADPSGNVYVMGSFTAQKAAFGPLLVPAYGGASTDAFLANVSALDSLGLPTMSATLSAGSFNLSWPMLAGGFVLEQTSGIGIPFAPFSYTATTNQAAGTITVTLPLSGTAGFYILQKP